MPAVEVFIFFSFIQALLIEQASLNFPYRCEFDSFFLDFSGVNCILRTNAKPEAFKISKYLICLISCLYCGEG